VQHWRGPAGAFVLALVAALILAAPVALADPVGPVATVAFESAGEVHLGTVDLGAGAPSITHLGSTGLPAATTELTGITAVEFPQIPADYWAVDTAGQRLVKIAASDIKAVTFVPLDVNAPEMSIAIGAAGSYIATGNQLRLVDQSTGETTVLATFPDAISGIAATCFPESDGRLAAIYAVAPATQQVYRVDPPSYTVTALPQKLGLGGVSAPKLTADRDTLWALNVDAVAPSTFIIDFKTGAATSVGNSASLGAHGLATTSPWKCSVRQPTASPQQAPPPPVDTTPTFTG
jgi:hypothetical protein